MLGACSGHINSMLGVQPMGQRSSWFGLFGCFTRVSIIAKIAKPHILFGLSVSESRVWKNPALWPPSVWNVDFHPSLKPLDSSDWDSWKNALAADFRLGTDLVWLGEQIRTCRRSFGVGWDQDLRFVKMLKHAQSKVVTTWCAVALLVGQQTKEWPLPRLAEVQTVHQKLTSVSVCDSAAFYLFQNRARLKSQSKQSQLEEVSGFVFVCCQRKRQSNKMPGQNVQTNGFDKAETVLNQRWTLHGRSCALSSCLRSLTWGTQWTQRDSQKQERMYCNKGQT